LEPPASGQTVVWDTTLAAFGCRVSQGGSKTFIVNRNKTFLTIGRYPIISLSEARTEAKRMMAEFTLGKIPLSAEQLYCCLSRRLGAASQA
jgi:hypothetical protein